MSAAVGIGWNERLQSRVGGGCPTNGGYVGVRSGAERELCITNGATAEGGGDRDGVPGELVVANFDGLVSRDPLDFCEGGWGILLISLLIEDDIVISSSGKAGGTYV